MVHLFFLYLSLSVVVRYVYVFRGRIVIWEGITDEEAMNRIRVGAVGTCVVSKTYQQHVTMEMKHAFGFKVIGLLLYVSGCKPQRYLRLYGRRDQVATLVNERYSYYAVAMVSLIINVGLRFDLWRKRRRGRIEEEDDQDQEDRHREQMRKVEIGLVRTKNDGTSVNRFVQLLNLIFSGLSLCWHHLSGSVVSPFKHFGERRVRFSLMSGRPAAGLIDF